MAAAGEDTQEDDGKHKYIDSKSEERGSSNNSDACRIHRLIALKWQAGSMQGAKSMARALMQHFH